MALSSPLEMRTLHLLKTPDILLANDNRPLGSYLAVNTREAKMDRDDPKIGRSNVENLAFHFLRPIRFGKGRPLAWATLLNQKLKVREGAHWAKYPRCSRRHSWILRRFSTPILIYGRK